MNQSGCCREFRNHRLSGREMCLFKLPEANVLLFDRSLAETRRRDDLAAKHQACQQRTIAMGLILLIVLVLLITGGLPNWNHSRDWGYGSSGGLGFVLMIVLILILMGRIPRGF